MTQVTLKVNLCFINFSLVDHFIVRKTLDEGLYMVYTFQVQKDRSKFLGIDGTKLDIVVRLLLLVFWNNRKHLLNYCVKKKSLFINRFLRNKIFLLKWSKWRGGSRQPKGYIGCTEYSSYSFYEKRLSVLQMKFTYIRYVLNTYILKFNNFSEKIHAVGLGFCWCKLWIPQFYGYGEVLLEFSKIGKFVLRIN